MGRQTGFEPATPGTTNQCSNQLSYYRHKRHLKLCIAIIQSMRKLEKGSALDPLANVRHHKGFYSLCYKLES